jgi:hypothetical protein
VRALARKSTMPHLVIVGVQALLDSDLFSKRPRMNHSMLAVTVARTTARTTAKRGHLVLGVDPPTQQRGQGSIL